jgi:hypothetical protein
MSLSIFEIVYEAHTGAEMKAVAIARDLEGARILLQLTRDEILSWKIIGTAVAEERPRDVAVEEPQLFTPAGTPIETKKEPIQAPQTTTGSSAPDRV